MDDLDLGQTLRGFAAGQKVFGRYTLERLLGRGGMGVVWLARDGELEQDVALKFLPEVVMGDNGAIDDMRRETRRARELTHPNVVRIHDLLRDSRMAAISMEYVAGDSLANRRLEQPSRVFEPEGLVRWVGQFCEALEYAHTKAKIVHCDLKPANLMVGARGELKVADFGISATLLETTTRVSRQANNGGTTVYMSPQQMIGERPTAADDIYSLGATLYELLTGKPPFYTGDILLQVQNKVSPSVAARRVELGVTVAGDDDRGIPAVWEETIAACLAKQPEDRPQSAAEVWARLSGTVSTAKNTRSTKTGKAGVAGLATEGTEGEESTEDGRRKEFTARSAEIGVSRPERPASIPSTPSMALASAQSQTDNRKSRLPLAIALAVAVVAASGAGWFFGVHQSAPQRQPRPVPDAEVVRQEKQHQAELARVEAARQEAETARKAAEERAAAAVRERDEQVRRAAEAVAKAERDQQGQAQQAEQQRQAEQARMEAERLAERKEVEDRADAAEQKRGAAGDSRLRQNRVGQEATGRVLLQGGIEGGKESALAANLERADAPIFGEDWVVRPEGLVLVWIAPGSFRMGSPEDEKWRSRDEGPVHRVTISQGFWLGRFEVTQAQWIAVMGYNASHHDRWGKSRPQNPVEDVTWFEAIKFCRRLTEREAKLGRLPDGYEYTLPTEAEWEYCCRADGDDGFAAIATGKSFERSAFVTSEVGSFPPNAWGLYDMQGNVAEWCADWYGPYSSESQADPCGPTAGKCRVYRGGHGGDFAPQRRAADRRYKDPERDMLDIGFRVALARRKPPKG